MSRSKDINDGILPVISSFLLKMSKKFIYRDDNKNIFAYLETLGNLETNETQSIFD